MDYNELATQRKKTLDRLSKHYALARSLGLSSYEANRVTGLSEENIRRIAAERNAKTEVK